MRKATIRQLEVELDADIRKFGRGHVRALNFGDHLGVDGWVLGNRAMPVTVEILDEDSQQVAEAAIDQPRPDVGEAFPDLPGASTCGFTALLRPPRADSSSIHFRVSFEDGEKAELATLACTLDNPDRPVGGSRWSLIGVKEHESEKVLEGKNGWLFLRADSNDVVGQQTGAVKLGPAGKARWRETLKSRVEASGRLGVPWACLVAPDKESVYPEYLPEAIKPAQHRTVHEFLKVAEEVNAPVAYALDWLEPAKAHSELYATTDTHWNYRGAFVAYRAFCDQLARQGVEVEPLAEERLQWFDLEFEGDLGSKVLPEPKPGRTIRVEVAEPEASLTFDNRVQNHGWVIRFEKGLGGRTCVLFGESFATHLLPFLKETFERLVFVHTSMFIPEVVALEQADVVLSLPLERFLIRVPDEEDALGSLQATVAKKGARLPWPVDSVDGMPPSGPTIAAPDRLREGPPCQGQ